ncbi:MAG: tetratricopeptide repeat protein [Cyclobacteriaceae bacterium]
MGKKQLILSAIAVALVVVLFLLPKVVIDNDSEAISDRGDTESNIEQGSPAATASVPAEAHSEVAPEEAAKKIEELRESYNNSRGSENFINFATSLSEVFASVNQYDSAAKYAAVVADAENKAGQLMHAADMYYEAFTYAMDADKASLMGQNARQYYEKVIAQEPGNLDAKAKMAMTYVSSSNPMQGITMLREVLEKDENNQTAIYNLGLLSLQSGQHDKAAERFEKLVSLSPDNLQAQFLLGVSYFESGQKEKARTQFEKVKKLDSDPAVTASVDNYLEQL